MAETAKTLGVIAGCILFIPGVLLVLFGCFTYVITPARQRHEITGLVVYVPLIGGSFLSVIGGLGLMGGLLVPVAPFVAAVILLCLGVAITAFAFYTLLDETHNSSLYIGVFFGLCYSGQYVLAGILASRML